MARGRWNPWRALRERAHITLEWTWLRGDRGQCVFHGDGTVTIHLDPRLSRRERRCVLAHELVHAERGVGYGRGTPSGLVEVEERVVWRETARRLVPPDELASLVAAFDGVPLELWEVAEHFDVDQVVARLACEALRARSVGG